MTTKKVASLISIIVAIAIVPLAGFGMKNLIQASGGTLDQHPYTSLEVVNSKQAPSGFSVATGLVVIISNRLGHGHTYRWTATQSSRVIIRGHIFVRSERSKRVTIPLDGAHAGRLTIALDDGSIFVRVPIHVEKPAGKPTTSSP